ncbi:5-(carboxyamino)imidazole ribonucleotide synthase [Rhodomicrobium sp.]|uniref:5-(carboxyamino)imidazole ribonucleotide synthase n=1 Tax=Rhodomicrobium sp. TaxID=2720632 RepID=UPI0039E6CA99
MTFREPLPPGSTIGIFGGGQLGRFLAVAAAKLGFKTAVYSSKEDSPAFQVASLHWCAPYTDEAALADFAQNCDVVTFEFENVPAAALEVAALRTPVWPPARAAAVTQDRIAEKRFLTALGLGTAPYAVVETEADLADAAAFLAQRGRGILKIAREGYDGKGQARVSSEAELRDAFKDFSAACVLEGMVDFALEISVIAVRGTDGAVSAYDCPENRHRNGILHQSIVPAACSSAQQAAAQEITARIAAALDYRGTLGVEFFVMPDGEHVLVNEIAPRVHNSGHWTMEACIISQFENHIRAVAGWPIGSVERHSDAVMTNLLGADVLEWQDILSRDAGASLHLYGKSEIKDGRKLGHVTQISPVENYRGAPRATSSLK